jgi:hypothetical protein
MEDKMKSHPLLKKALAALGLVGLVLSVYFIWARPYQIHWGATAEEIRQNMPGDDLNPNPKFLATRAITIDSTPEAIWPWLIQMGYGRAGYYGYDILENLGSLRGLPSAESILPEFQDFKVGDLVPISPAAKMSFYAIQPDKYLIWAGKIGTYGTFTWALYPVDASHTRLVSRIRWSHHWSQPGILALDLFSEFTDHLAVRKILQGIKERVEGYSQPLALGTIEFAIYLVAALLFFAALVLVLIRPLTWRGWLAGLAAGIIWLVVWYGPIPVWVGAMLELFVTAGLIRAFRRTLPPETVSPEPLPVENIDLS